MQVHVNVPGTPEFDVDAEGNEVPSIEVPGLGVFFNGTQNEVTEEEVATYNLFHPTNPFPESGTLYIGTQPEDLEQTDAPPKVTPPVVVQPQKDPVDDDTKENG